MWFRMQGLEGYRVSASRHHLKGELGVSWVLTVSETWLHREQRVEGNVCMSASW